MTKTVYTLDEFAKYLGVSRTTARSRTRLPGFPTVRCGGRILIPIRAYEAWRRDQIRGIARKGGKSREKTGGQAE